MAPTVRGRYASSLVPLVFALLACALSANTWSVFGHTWDEPEHLAAGMELLDQGRYEYDLQHPPLVRLMIAAGPYLAGARSMGTKPPDGGPEGLRILYDSGRYDRLLSLARLGTLPFVGLLVWVTWLWGRRALPPGGAALATAFIALTPVVLGHGALATLDVPAAATCLLALYCLQRWIEIGSWSSAVALGLAAGLAVITKLSALPFLAAGPLVLVPARFITARAAGDRIPMRPGARRWGELAVAACLVLACITAVYGGHFSYWTNPSHRYAQALAYVFGDSGPMHDLAYWVAARVPLPEGLRLMIGGIQAVTVHNANGHESYLLGEVRYGGWWYFYIVALAVKTPLPLLVLGVVGLAWQAGEGWRRRDSWELAPALLFVAILAFCSVFSRINIGVRHVVILYPLLALGAAHSLIRLYESVLGLRSGVLRLLGSAMLAAVFAWQVLVPLRSWPDYLAYFNETVREPRLVLVDSDLDWGQDLRRLSQRLAELRIPSVSLGYRGTARLSMEGLPPNRLLGPDERVDGWIAVSALARVSEPGAYSWLDAYRPVERIGRTIDLYHLEPGEVARQ